jgi:hypothetical protein
MSATPRSLTALSTQTTNYSPTSNDGVVEYNASSGALTATMPDATLLKGKSITLKKVDSSANTISITFTGSQVADLRNSIILRQHADFVTLQSNGTNWDIVAKKETEVYVVAVGNTTFTGRASSDYMAMSGNSIALGIGTWRVSGAFNEYNGAVNAGLFAFSGIYASQGTNSSTSPTRLSSVAASIQGYTDFDGAFNAGGDIVINTQVNGQDLVTGNLDFVVVLTSPQTIYIVPRVYINTTSNGFVRATMKAERVW